MKTLNLWIEQILTALCHTTRAPPRRPLKQSYAAILTMFHATFGSRIAQNFSATAQAPGQEIPRPGAFPFLHHER
jgi:hypothetical protein